jgi:PKD repeat protein
MKLTNLFILISSVLALTACKSDCCTSDEKSTQVVQVDRFLSADVEAMSVASLSSTVVCIDTNNDDSCVDEHIFEELPSGTGTVTLRFYDWNFDTEQIIAQNSEFVYKIKANTIHSSPVLYLNPVTDAATRLGNEKLKEITGYTGDLEDFSPTVELSENLKILADCIAKLTQEQNPTDKVFDISKVQERLKGSFNKIIEQLNNGQKPTQIVENIITGNDKELPPSEHDNKAPVADFDILIKNGGFVNFVNKSSDEDDDKLQYQWSFGDGFISYDKNPTHYFSSNETYQVQLLVSDGKSSSVLNKTLIFGNVTGGYFDIKPSFDFKVDGLTVKLTNQTIIANDVNVEYVWDFGDGNTSLEKSPVYTYQQEGVYEITLKINADGRDPIVLIKPIIIKSLPVEEEKPSGPEEPILSSIKADIKALVLGKRVLLVPEIEYQGENAEQLTYHWEFGDGQTSSDKNTTHEYEQYANYEISLNVSDGVISQTKTTEITVADDNHNELCPQEEPFCKGQIDPAECAQICVEETQTVCTGAIIKGPPDLASMFLSSVETPYYATNPNKQKGVNKTITSMSDWTPNMIIAQGAANDDPRSFYGNHEFARDLYALYAAYDEQNLYLMIEMPNLDGHEVGSPFDFLTACHSPIGIGLRTGVRIPGTGKATDGNTVWNNREYYSIKEGIDTLLMFTPDFKKGRGAIYKTNSEGKFTYDSENHVYEMSFEEAGITSVVEYAPKSQNYWGFADNKGKDPMFFLEEGYIDLLAQNPKASGYLYQLTIPLKSLDITMSDIKNHGVGVMAFSTIDGSMMDALPWTPNLVDNANLPYSFDNYTSHEKEDFDLYDVPLAEVGDDKDICHIIVQTKCTPKVIPETCSLSKNIDVTLNHKYYISDEHVVVFMQAFTGYIGVQYQWEVIGSQAKIISFDDATKGFIFNKKDLLENVVIKLNVKNSSGSKTGSTSFAVGTLE